jgi:phosphoribosylformylglycinamidine cyclo-ligase
VASWELPAIFAWLAEHGPVAADELWRTFNCGVGMVAVVAATEAGRAVEVLTARGVPAWRLGEVVPHRPDGPRVRLDTASDGG